MTFALFNATVEIASLVVLSPKVSMGLFALFLSVVSLLPEALFPSRPRISKSFRVPSTGGKQRKFEGLTMTEAEDLLDWLEAHGCVGAQVSLLGERGMAVECPWPV
jgi:hypothetical protein